MEGGNRADLTVAESRGRRDWRDRRQSGKAHGWRGNPTDQERRRKPTARSGDFNPRRAERKKREPRMTRMAGDPGQGIGTLRSSNSSFESFASFVVKKKKEPRMSRMTRINQNSKS